MTTWAAVAVTTATFLGMEFVAWFMHKYVLHGALWFLHRSHHVRHPHHFERNDFFFLFYGALSMGGIMYGSDEKSWPFWVGIGIAAYGTVYFFVHDVLIHGRLRFWRKSSNKYLRALNMAHKMHHKTTGRDGSEEFGMLWVSPKYLELARRKPAPVRSGKTVITSSNS
ncbi:sterol desaturase family protein [Hymenobacter cellulosilyticus]|uniref:Sterol desaturase family protein n=1 Tax=Hymenobacter cellulosilyticus TaxID=2932248 RepID=A0A8T9QCT5_9BACT|nr:sterol desaturase family protein [Hymenobacter cellulosilyticus]UOQ74742.1 sterol desaturase family protein [Hymenobacter cellulosilyticus]